MKTALSPLACALFAGAMFACAMSAAAQLNLMPMPATVRPGRGALAIRDDFSIGAEGAADPRVAAAIGRAMEHLAAKTGVTSVPRQVGTPTVLTIRVASQGSAVQTLEEDESYRLSVAASGARIEAPNPLGAMHGLETFLQLVENTASGWSAAAVEIEDRPRFPWRGLHLDVARHFMPLSVVRRNLDGMAAVKLNVFHWHLSDDQGFRVESRRFPKLQSAGSDGLFYTQDEVRGIVSYARERGIRVVPEFDIPGHAASWLAGYPELAAGPGPFAIVRRWGVFDPTLDPAKPEVYTFLDAFIGEMAELFPDRYLHIGGDEVNGRQWTANRTDIPPFMAAQGLSTPAALQAYFNRRVQQIVARYGKKMEGWDEILNPALPKDILIQSWRGAKSLAQAAREGYSGILSAGYYLDHMEPAATLYMVDPLGGLAGGLNAEEKTRILGGEVCMWAEYVSPENVDSRIWPRTAAVAERFWSPAELRDAGGMYARLDSIDAELDRRGLMHNRSYALMLARLAGTSSVDALKALADVLEPGALGLRHRVNPDYLQSTPLNRLVDVARPDSAVARRFATLVDRCIAKPSDLATRNEIRQWLSLWAANDAQLQPLIARRKLLAEAAPVSALLARLAKNPSAADLATAGRPVGEVTLAVAAPLRRLREAGFDFAAAR